VDDTRDRYIDHLEAEIETLKQQIRHLYRQIAIERIKGRMKAQGIDWTSDDE
jgi:hypothetical protein